VGNVGRKSRELDDDAMRGSVVVESREAAMQEAGEILIPGVPICAELGEILSGRVAPPGKGPVVFKSLGIAATDIATARLVHEALSANAR
jgi:thiomorpholine-carboxylate dehydrogenase